MTKSSMKRVAYPTFLLCFLIILHISRPAEAIAPKIQQLYDYCLENHAINLVDGTDGEIVCRNGDPRNIFNDSRITELWNALSAEQQQKVIDTDHCQERYGDMGDTILESCREMVDPHTGIVRNPVDTDLPGPRGTDPGENQGSDIFGTSREDLQNCRGAACVNDNPITKIIIFIINVLSALIGVVVVGVIVMAGIQYSSSGGSPQATAQAKKRILNAIIALIVYFFLFAILQWLIPGGLFKR